MQGGDPKLHSVVCRSASFDVSNKRHHQYLKHPCLVSWELLSGEARRTHLLSRHCHCMCVYRNTKIGSLLKFSRRGPPPELSPGLV